MNAKSTDLVLSDAELAVVRSRVASATPGPWTSYVVGRAHMSGSDFIMTSAADIYLADATRADQDFIASARQDVPTLLAEIDRLTTLLAQRGG